MPEYELAEDPEYDEPDRVGAEDGAEGDAEEDGVEEEEDDDDDGGADDDDAEPAADFFGADDTDEAEEADEAEAADGAWLVGAADDVEGVNDGARSRGVKTDGVFFAASSPASAGEAAGACVAPLGFAIPSAGSGTAFVVESPGFSVVVTVSSLDFPFAPVTGVASVRVTPAPADPERELPVLVRDDDMELLSTTASSSATS